MSLMDLQSQSRLPIAQLHPSIESSERYIRGIITLIWPYSSSNQSISILVVEPDFRLRRKQGQVRITFKGASAKAVAKSGITSGYEVLVALPGVEWVRDDTSASTPGRGVEWELQFGKHLNLQYMLDAGQPHVLDLSASPPSPTLDAASHTPPRSPIYYEIVDSNAAKLPLKKTQTWSSPAFLKRKNLPATSIFNSLYDPFGDSELADHQPPKRTKFGSASGQWRFSERTPSPEKQDEQKMLDVVDSPVQVPANDGISKPLEQDLPMELALYIPQPDKARNAELWISPLPLAIDTRASTTKSFHSDDDVDESTLPEQPRLRGLPSAGLPLVSPLLDRQNRMSHYIPLEIEDSGLHKPNTDSESYEGSKGSGEMKFLEPSTSDVSATVIQTTERISNDFSHVFSTEHNEGLHESQVGQIRPGSNTVAVITENSSWSDNLPFVLHDTPMLEPNKSNMPTSPLDESAGYDPVSLPQDGNAEHDSLLSGDAKRSKSHTDDEVFDDFVETTYVDGGTPTDGDDESGNLQLLDDNFPIDFRDISQARSRSDESDHSDEEDEKSGDEDDWLSSIIEEAEGSSLSRHPEDGDRKLEVFTIDSNDEQSSREEKQPLPVSETTKMPTEDQVKPDLAATDRYQYPYSRLGGDTGNIEWPLLPFTPEASGISKLFVDEEASEGGKLVRSVLHEAPHDPEENLSVQLEREKSQDSYDSSARNQLATPLATQVVDREEYASESKEDTGVQEGDHDVPSTYSSQITKENKVTSEARDQAKALLELLRNLRNASKQRSADRTDIRDHPDINSLLHSDNDGKTRTTNIGPTTTAEESEIEIVVHEDQARYKSDGINVRGSNPPERFPHHGSTQLHANDALQTPFPSGFRTPLSYFPPLLGLSQYFNSTIDTFAVAISSSKPDRSKHGPRDYVTTIYITDPSTATSKQNHCFCVAQIFRPLKIALPLVQTGDALLLRNFKVQSREHKPRLLSTESSAWAVFSKGHDVQIRGPGVEFGAEERGFAKGLGDWWHSLPDDIRLLMISSVPKTEGTSKKNGKEKVNKRKSTGRRSNDVVHELRDGTKYTDGREDGMNGLHELRDGTIYNDDTV